MLRRRSSRDDDGSEVVRSLQSCGDVPVWCGVSDRTSSETRQKIVLLFDTSSSMTWLFQDPMSLAVGRLTGQHLTSPGDEALRAAASSLGPEAQMRVGTFGEHHRLSPVWLQKDDAIPPALVAVAHEGGLSPIPGRRLLLPYEQLEATPDRRVILLVSDGRSSGNVHGFEEALDRARRSEVTVHVALSDLQREKADTGS